MIPKALINLPITSSYLELQQKFPYNLCAKLKWY
jgi:hypothetical protein